MATVFFTTERCVCRNLLRKDIDTRCSWVPYDSPLIGFYNLGPKNPIERDRLFEKWKSMKRRWYSFDLKQDREFLGILSLREISRFTRSSRLGIVLNPLYTNKGFGTEIMQAFIDYYFLEIGFKKMLLDVARFNKRAIRCYEKCGFRTKGEFWRRYPGDPAVILTQEYQDNKDCFKFKQNQLFTVYDDMVLTLKDWRKRLDAE